MTKPAKINAMRKNENNIAAAQTAMQKNNNISELTEQELQKEPSSQKESAQKLAQPDQVINIARIYARRKGKSRSKKPLVPAKWVEYNREEIERIIVKLAKDRLQTAQIGLVLRDSYGIPSVKAVSGASITKILEKNNISSKLPEDMFNLLKKAVNLRNHMDKNKRDAHSKRGLELLESKIRRLGKYYISRRKLPESWKYDPEQAKLIVERGG